MQSPTARYMHTAMVAITLAGLPASGIAQSLPIQLDTVTAVGTRVAPGLAGRTRSVQVLDRETLEELPVRTVAQALEWALAVDVMARSAAQADVAIRGSSFEQVLVLIDGVPVSDPQTGHFDMDLGLPLDQVERIEVLRGPASAQYGADAMGGAINVVTKGATQPLGGRIEAGSFGTVAGTIGAGFRVGHVRMAAGGALNRSDGYREGTDYDVRQLQLKLESPLAAGNVAAQLGHSRKNFGAADFYAPFPSYEETRTTRFAAWWRGSLGRDVELEPRLWVRRHNDDFVLHRDDPTRYTNSHLSSQLGAEAVVRYRVGDGFDLAFGGLAGRDLLESSNLGDRSQNRWAVYGEAVTEIGSATLNAGLRGDGYQDYGFVLSPSVSAAVWLSQLRFRGSFAGSFRTPTWTERYYEDPYNRGQPDLEPERGWTTEVGADLWMTDDMSLNLTAFSRRSRDLIDWARSSTVDDTSVWLTTNVKSATFYGLEGGLSGVVAATRVSLQASATSLTSDNDPGLVSKYALRPLVRELILQLGRDLGPARANLSSRYRRRQYEDGYWLLDVRMGLPFQFGEIYLDLLNALGVEYRRINGVLAPGRSFMLGFRYLGSM